MQRIQILQKQLKNTTNSFKNFNKTTLFNFSSLLKYKYNYGSVKIPHFSKRDKGGEDALFTHEGLICVADGVGGWSEVGVDPSKYSNELVGNIGKHFLRGNAHLNPKALFAKSCNETRSMGSATCCFCLLDTEKNYFHAVNMGDSGYLLLRKSSNLHVHHNEALNKVLNNKKDKDNQLQILYKSEEQQHSFNFPYQVGTHGDDPNEAEIKVHQFEENDIIVLGTDGLWDNVFVENVRDLISEYIDDTTNVIRDLNSVAMDLGKFTEKLSLDGNYNSPFCVRSGGLYRGGKPDDITIIVAQIVRNNV